MKQGNDFKETKIGKIPEGWDIKKLCEVAKFVDDKIEIRSISLLNYISTENMLPNKGGIITITSKPLSGKATKFREGDILFSNIRTYFKKIWLAKFIGGCSNDVLVIRVEKKIYEKYLYYYLSQNVFFNYTVLSSKGTKMPRGDKEAIMQYPIFIPPLAEQKAISKILSDLDSKIELNNQMNATLEAMAQAIFKHWFIDFEFPDENGKPYKSNGGKMVDSELGKIPEGWEVKNIQDILAFEKGTEPGSKYYFTENSKERVRFIRVRDLEAIEHDQIFVPRSLVNGKSCNEDDILLSLDATIGRIKIGIHGAFSSGIRKVYSKDKGLVPKAYIYSLLKSKYTQNIMEAYANGTTILHAGVSLNYIDVAIPDINVFKKFSKITDAFFDKLVNNIIEINNLKEIRDSLLPKLMSGQIRVPVEVIKNA